MRKRGSKIKVWVVTVDMGYGHQRATYPLKYLAYKGIVNANCYSGIPQSDRNTWHDQRKFYEAISRFKGFPILGGIAFNLFDQLQKIPDFYPKRDLSKPSLQVRTTFGFIKKRRWGRHLIKKLSKKPLPLVTSFFAVAFMAEIHNYPGDIYCIICDADISRAWVSLNPQKSRIRYFAPCNRVVERLKLYGVPKERIFLTGFPLPPENVGSPALGITKFDLRHRLLNLDPEKNYISQYKDTLQSSLKIKSFPKRSNHPLTLTFAVGGAGAQRELGARIVEKFSEAIKNRRIRINLVAGVHRRVNAYFQKVIKRCDLQKHLNKEVRILYTPSKSEYLKTFNEWLRKTDVLWTKPSELSFYCALGLPIIIAPPIGSQEDFNRDFLIDLGAGITQDDLDYLDEWFFDWIKSGRLAEAAAQGFLETPKSGLYNIEKILSKNLSQVKKIKIISHY